MTLPEQKTYRSIQEYDRRKEMDPQQVSILADKGVFKEDRNFTQKEIEDFYDAFILRVIDSGEVFFNECPYCGQLARTPKGRQAKCGHAWRDHELVEEDGIKRWVKMGN